MIYTTFSGPSGSAGALSPPEAQETAAMPAAAPLSEKMSREVSITSRDFAPTCWRCFLDMVV